MQTYTTVDGVKITIDADVRSLKDFGYTVGYTPPHYPVPSLIVHVDNAGLANGLEQRDAVSGEIIFKVWDTPMPNGEMCILPTLYYPWFEGCMDIDYSDWY